MRATRYGGMDLPVPVAAAGDAASDPALDKILAFLKAVLNANAAAQWAAIAPATPLPVSGTFAHNPGGPEGVSFNSRCLPALFLFREDTVSESQADDYDVTKTSLTLLWVPPAAAPPVLVQRSPFINAVDKIVIAALSLGRDPAWIDSGDAEAQAAYNGSFLPVRAGLWRCGPVSSGRTLPVVIEIDKTPANYAARRYTIPIEERLVLGGYDEFEGVLGELQTTDDPPFVTNNIELLL